MQDTVALALWLTGKQRKTCSEVYAGLQLQQFLQLPGTCLGLHTPQPCEMHLGVWPPACRQVLLGTTITMHFYMKAKHILHYDEVQLGE